LLKSGLAAVGYAVYTNFLSIFKRKAIRRRKIMKIPEFAFLTDIHIKPEMNRQKEFSNGH